MLFIGEDLRHDRTRSGMHRDREILRFAQNDNILILFLAARHNSNCGYSRSVGKLTTPRYNARSSSESQAAARSMLALISPPNRNARPVTYSQTSRIAAAPSDPKITV